MSTKAVCYLINGYEKYTNEQDTNEPNACELVRKVNTDSSQQFASRSGSQQLQPYPQTVLYVARNLLALEWPAWPPPYKNPLTAWVTFQEAQLFEGKPNRHRLCYLLTPAMFWAIREQVMAVDEGWGKKGEEEDAKIDLVVRRYLVVEEWVREQRLAGVVGWELMECKAASEAEKGDEGRASGRLPQPEISLEELQSVDEVVGEWRAASTTSKRP
jgi:hypothetical protein